MPSNKTPHPIFENDKFWSFLTHSSICVTVCVALGLFLKYNYNRFDARDWATIFGGAASASAALYGVNQAKSKFIGKSEPTQEEGNEPSGDSE